MSKDANEIAAETARREARGELPDLRPPAPPRGTLMVWPDGDLERNPMFVSNHVTLDLRVQPGIMVAYDEEGSAEIFGLGRFTYASFVPDKG